MYLRLTVPSCTAMQHAMQCHYYYGWIMDTSYFYYERIENTSVDNCIGKHTNVKFCRSSRQSKQRGRCRSRRHFPNTIKFTGVRMILIANHVVSRTSSITKSNINNYLMNNMCTTLKKIIMMIISFL